MTTSNGGPGPRGETFAWSGGADCSAAGHGDDFPPLTCPVKGDPRECCTYSFQRPLCPEARAVLLPPARRRSWLARLLRWGR